MENNALLNLKLVIVQFFNEQTKKKKPISLPTVVIYLQNNLEHLQDNVKLFLNDFLKDENALNDLYQGLKQEYKKDATKTLQKYTQLVAKQSTENIEENPIQNTEPQPTGWNKPMIRNKEGKLRIGDTQKEEEKPVEKEEEKVEDGILPSPQSVDEKDIEELLQNMSLKEEKVNEKDIEELLQNMSLKEEEKHIEKEEEKVNEKDIEELLQNMPLQEEKPKVKKTVDSLYESPQSVVAKPKNKQLTKMQQLHKEVQKEIKEATKHKLSFLTPEQLKNKNIIMGMTNEIKTALPYYAMLSYYLADKSIPVTDPFLTSFFSGFYKVESEFQDKFIALNPTARINFINDYFQNKRLKDIHESLLNNTLVNKESIQETIDKYLPVSNVIDVLQDELNANTMYYILSVDTNEDEFNNKDELSKSLSNQISQVLIDRMKNRDFVVSEEDVKKHINIQLENVNSQSELINHIHQAQTRLSQDVDEDIVQDIQDLYTEAYPQAISRI